MTAIFIVFGFVILFERAMPLTVKALFSRIDLSQHSVYLGDVMTLQQLIECLQRAPEEVKGKEVFIYGFGDIQEIVVSKTERLDVETVSWGITIKGKTQ